MYRERAEPGRNTPIPDDLDLLKPDLPDPPGEDKDYNPFEAARNGTFIYDDDDDAAERSSDVELGASGRERRGERPALTHGSCDDAGERPSIGTCEAKPLNALQS